MVILMWIFMGIWPYMKLFLSLVIWMVPPKYLGITRRGTVLIWIDALARLSVIDIFTLIIGFAILLIFIGGPDESIDGGGAYYALKAIVVPQAGCYCIVVAKFSFLCCLFYNTMSGCTLFSAALFPAICPLHPDFG